MKTTVVLLSLLCIAAVHAAADLYISEVYYDHSGSDSSYDWVEILNTGTTTTVVDGYILAWGGSDYGYGFVELQGEVAACSHFVVGIGQRRQRRETPAVEVPARSTKSWSG